MMIFNWDSGEVAIWKGSKTEKALARALRLAGNQAIRAAKKQSVAHVRSKKLIREEVVEKRMPLTSADSKEAIADLEWTERVGNKPMPLVRFPHIKTAFGITVRVNVNGGKGRLKSAFEAKVGAGGHVGIFMRTGVFGRRGNPKLERIKELFTSRVSDSMADPGAMDGARDAAAKRMRKAFQKGLARELLKLKKKGDA